MINKLAALGTMAALGAASHLATNAIAVGADKVDTGGRKHDLHKRPGIAGTKHGVMVGKLVHGAKARALHTGILHGMDPKRKHSSTAAAVIEALPLVGSAHYTFHYHMGHKVGEKYKGLSLEQKRAKLQDLHDTIASIQHHEDFPHLGALKEGIHRALSGHKPFHSARTLEEQEDKRSATQKVDDYIKRHHTLKGKLKDKASAAGHKTHKAIKAVGHAKANLADKVTPARIKRKIVTKSVEYATKVDTKSQKGVKANTALAVAVHPRLTDLQKFPRAAAKLTPEQRAAAGPKFQHIAKEFA